MSVEETLIIDRVVQPGEKFSHQGSIVFKKFVPDNVEAEALKGGLVLEQGGGNGLKLTAKFNQSSAKTQLSGVASKASLGDNVTIITDVSINITHAGSKLKAEAGGSFYAGDICNQCVLDVGGSVYTSDIGSNAKVDAGGSLKAAYLGEGGDYDIGGSATIAGQITANVSLDAGGSIKAGKVGENVCLDAGGSITVDAADSSATLDAGGSVRIGKQKKKFDF